MNQRRIRIAVGAFLVVTVGLLLTAAGYALYRKGLFEDRAHYTLVAESGQHLSPGMPVVFQSLKLGVVERLDLNPRGQVEARISIPADQRRWVRESSTFTVEKPLLGGARIVVATEDMDAPLLPEGARPRTQVRDDINRLIQRTQPVVEDLQRIVDHVSQLTGKAADPEGDIQQTLSHLERFSGRLAEEPALLTLLTDNPETARNLDATLGELHRTVARARTQLLGEDGTAARVDALLDDVQAKLATLDPAVREVAASTQGMEELRDELQITIEDTRSILDRLESIVGEQPPGQVPLP